MGFEEGESRRAVSEEEERVLMDPNRFAECFTAAGDMRSARN